MDGSFAALALRMLLSLAIVVGLLALAARFPRRQGLVGTRPAAHWARVEVLSRQALGRTSGVAVVRVTGRVLLLGVSDHGVRVLTELEPGEDTPPEVGQLSASPRAQPTNLLDALRELTVRRAGTRRKP